MPKHVFQLCAAGRQKVGRATQAGSDAQARSACFGSAVARQDPPKETSAGIQAIVGELKKQLPDTKVLLLAIFPRGEKPDDRLRKINDGINEIIAGYADDEKVFFLDINDKFLTQDGTLPKSIMPDLLHPNDKGYAIWAETIEPTIAKLMGESSAD